MKSFSVTAAGSLVLALVLASPAMANEPQDQPVQTQQGSNLPTRRVDQLTGTKVVNDKNEEIGKVEAVVREKGTNKVCAVVGVGGFLGIGRHDVTIALQDLALHGDRLAAPPGTTKEQLKNMPE